MREESGQATTEYMMILAIVMVLAVSIFNTLRPFLEDAQEALANNFRNRLGRNIHHIRISR